MSNEQQELHDQLLQKLFEVLDDPIVKQMNLGTLLEVVKNFTASTYYNACKSTNRMDLLKERVVASEVKEMIKSLKANK
jgi:hypothetical protein